MKLVPVILLLAAAWGCAGPREKPVFEPPMLSEPEAAAPASSSASLVGAWTTTSIRGPGSAWLRRIDVLFHADGRYLAVADGEGVATLVSGRWTTAADAVTIARDGAGPLRFERSAEGAALILRSGGAELRLEPFRE